MNYKYLRKDADTNRPLLDVLKKRWSPVNFSSDKIDKEMIETLFEAARWTQSSRNTQPWRFIYATKDDPKNFECLANLLSEGNGYAKNAYLLLLGCAVLNYEDREGVNQHAQYDTGAAMNNIFLQAVSMDLIAHEIGGFDKERAFTQLNIPKNVEPMAMMAIGYPTSPEEVEERFLEKQNRPRVRKTLKEIVFKDKWVNK